MSDHHPMNPSAPQSKLWLACLVVFACEATLSPLSAQSIFRDKRDDKPRQPIIPTIVAPEGPVVPEPEPEENEEEPVVAQPVAPRLSPAEIALNRRREAAANRSNPGVVSLLGTAGQLNRLAVTQVDLEEEKRKAEEERIKQLEKDPLEDRLKAEFHTREDARTFTFSIPAARGQILDRKGRPLAQSKVAHYAAIMFPQWGDDVDEAAILKYGAERILHVNNMLGTNWDLQPKILRNHYQNRRWMPLLFSGALTQAESDRLRRAKVEGLKLIPSYLRHYPNEKMLSHVLGYVGKRPPRATGPIANEEPVWGAGIGVQGLEKYYDKYLTGVPGKYSELYDEHGNKLREDTISKPRPGYNIITTIDIDAQRIMERLLRERTKHSAMVLFDCTNGDVVAMASYPQFNPNDFIPSISQAKYSQLANDPSKPLYGRAFQGAYPPASTYKIASALSFLEDKAYPITPYDTRPCPARWTIGSGSGSLTMRNWNKNDEGDMNVVSAIARSCNTWFYEIATYVGADAMHATASRLGLGEKTGLTLDGENSGFIPNNDYWIKNYNARLSDGDEANSSIGQGRVKTTPIQVARMMGAVGNQKELYNSRLVLQVQDVNHNVVDAFPAVSKNSVGIRPESLKAVREGMWNVVNAGWGTGNAGYHKVTVSAKTGTGQWIPGAHRNIAWFAGYFPAKNPIYSFAIVYEGEPYEEVSGGKKAAPIVSSFLNEYLNWERLANVRKRSAEQRGEVYQYETYQDRKDPEDELIIETTSNTREPSAPSESDDNIFRGREQSTAPTAAPAATPAQNASPRRGTLFNRIFKRKGGR